MSDQIVLKRCTKCKRDLLFSEFHRSTSTLDGYKYHCKDCRRIESGTQKRRAAPIPNAPGVVRSCPSCKRILPYSTDHFGNHGKRLDWLCKECSKIYKKDHQNPEAQKIRLKRFHERHPHYGKSQYWKNPIKAREEKRKHRKNSEYFRSPKYKILSKIHTHRRLARKRNLPNNFGSTDWIECVDYFHECCAVCRRQGRDLFGTHTLSADHWIPLSSPDCPGTIPSNIIPLCHGIDGCNNSKSASDPIKWLNERYGKRKASNILKRINAYFDSLKK